jgi:hypothetical protein
MPGWRRAGRSLHQTRTIVGEDDNEGDVSPIIHPSTSTFLRQTVSEKWVANRLQIAFVIPKLDVSFFCASPHRRILGRLSTYFPKQISAATGTIDILAGPAPDQLWLFPTRVIELPGEQSLYLFTIIQPPSVPDAKLEQQHRSLLREFGQPAPKIPAEWVHTRMSSDPNMHALPLEVLIEHAKARVSAALEELVSRI